MSNLTQFAPFAGGGLKSYQTGFVAQAITNSGSTGTEDAAVLNITVSAVTVAKTITGFEGTTGPTVVADYNDGIYPTTRMTSTTNLRLASTFNPSSYNYRINGRWSVVESN